MQTIKRTQGRVLLLVEARGQLDFNFQDSPTFPG